MDKFLGFKTEEILTCLLLVVVGYFIAKMFSGCGCANRVDGFSVGIQDKFQGATCTPRERECRADSNDKEYLYTCSSSGVCERVTRRCGPYTEDCQDTATSTCEHNGHLCENNCIAPEGGNNGYWDGGDGGRFGGWCKVPAPAPPAPNPPPPPAVDRCQYVEGLNEKWREDKENYMTNSCSHDPVYLDAKNKGQDVLCCVNASECVGTACKQENMEDTVKNKGKNVCTNSKYNNISGKFPGPNTSDEYNSKPVNCWYISDSDPLWSKDDCDENDSGDTKGHGLGCYYLEGDAPQPTNDCDIAVATQWKNIICDTKDKLDQSMNNSDTYNTIQQKLQQIKDKDSKEDLRPFSFDYKDISQMGCNKYANSNYCIQGVQGTATCKAKDGSNKAHVDFCKNITPLKKANCNSNGSCIWRIPNLIDENIEEFSEQPGACSRKCNNPDGCKKDEDTLPQVESYCEKANNLLWCSNSNTGNSILGELPIENIIGKDYSELNKYCNPSNDYKPINPSNKKHNILKDLRHKRNMLRDELSELESRF